MNSNLIEHIEYAFKPNTVSHIEVKTLPNGESICVVFVATLSPEMRDVARELEQEFDELGKTVRISIQLEAARKHVVE